MPRKPKYTTFEEARAAHVQEVAGIPGLISTRIEFERLTARGAMLRTKYRCSSVAIMSICMQNAPTSFFVDVSRLPCVSEGFQTSLIVVDDEIVDLNDAVCQFDIHIKFKRRYRRKSPLVFLETLEMSPAEVEARIRANQRA